MSRHIGHRPRRLSRAARHRAWLIDAQRKAVKHAIWVAQGSPKKPKPVKDKVSIWL